MFLRSSFSNPKPDMIKSLKKHQRVHRSVALYRWQVTMRLAAQIDALKKKRRTVRSAGNDPRPTISFDN